MEVHFWAFSIIYSPSLMIGSMWACVAERTLFFSERNGLAVSSTKSNTVNDIPELASEPAAAFRCKPEVGSETREFF